MAGFLEGEQAGLPMRPVSSIKPNIKPMQLAAPLPTARRPHAGGFDPNAYVHPERHMGGAEAVAMPPGGGWTPQRPPLPAPPLGAPLIPTGPQVGGNMGPGSVARTAMRRARR